MEENNGGEPDSLGKDFSEHNTTYLKFGTKVHWFLKQCLHDLCLTQKSGADMSAVVT